MANISFIAILIGAAGVAGGIETGSMAGVIAAAVLHFGGIVGMTMAIRKEGDETDEDEEDNGTDPGGNNPMDKPYGTCSGRHAADSSGGSGRGVPDTDNRILPWRCDSDRR